QPCTRCAERMTERNRTSIDIRRCAIQSEFFLDREVLRSERLVNFNKIYVVECNTSFFQCGPSRGHRTDSHNFRFNTSIRPTDYAPHGSQILRFHEFLISDDQGCRAINDAGSVTPSYKSIPGECRPQFRQTLKRGFRSRVAVASKSHDACALFHLARDNLLREITGVEGALGFLLRTQRILVLVFARHFKLSRQVLSCPSTRCVAIRIEQRNHQAVLQSSLSEREPGTSTANDVWGLRHRFHATTETRLCFTQLNHVRAGDNRLDATTAKSIHGKGRALKWNTSLKSHVTGSVDRISRSLQRVTKHGVVNLFGMHPGSPQRTTSGNRS